MIVLGPDELTDTPLAWPIDSSTVLAQGTITSYVQDQVRTPDGHADRAGVSQAPWSGRSDRAR